MDVLKMRDDLLSGKKRMAVWGTGYIGFSTMAYFALSGVRVIGTDTNQKIVDSINSGQVVVPNMEFWLGFDVKPLVESGLMSATASWKDLLSPDVSVHLIAIPTEKEGAPWDDALADVIGKIAGAAKKQGAPLVIVESTLTPGKTDSLVIPLFEKKGLKVGEDVLVGVAPRRDWFISPEKNLRTLPRAIGGTNGKTTGAIQEVLGIVCQTLVPAKDHKHAEMVKSIENAYRHVEITLANQLSLAFPEIDMREVLRIVGTKWNIGTYNPSFGTGGYCIPLSSQYVLGGTRHPEVLTILRSTVSTDSDLPAKVAESVAARGAKKVGVLGLAYKGDLKVHILSPAIKIIQKLKEMGISVKVNDPYYTDEELKRITGAESFVFPDGLAQFDAVLVTCDHNKYRFTQDDKVVSSLKNCRVVLDNANVWPRMREKFAARKIGYWRAGEAGWLSRK